MASESAPQVPIIQGKAKHGKEKARPIIENGEEIPLKVFHSNSSTGKP